MSGLSHLPAKEAYLKYGTEGSNPSLSARLHNVMKIRTYRFGFWYTIHEEAIMQRNGSFSINNGETKLSKHIDLGKKVFIPDPGERTDNDPSYLMSSNDVLKLIKTIYPENTPVEEKDILLNILTVESGKEVITQHLVDGIIKQATVHHGWSEVKLIGKQLLFIK